MPANRISCGPTGRAVLNTVYAQNTATALLSADTWRAVTGNHPNSAVIGDAVVYSTEIAYHYIISF